jgi:hypothetical protein
MILLSFISREKISGKTTSKSLFGKTFTLTFQLLLEKSFISVKFSQIGKVHHLLLPV